MIPKVIHYVWVGPKPTGKVINFCIQSWKKNFPDFEIKLWNESNSPMEHQFIREMYKRKKWAFVSDYIRFWVLYNEGGIYLDTDMEVLRPFDNFLNENVFFGRTRDGFVACGIIGATPGNILFKKILDFYDDYKDYNIINTSPQIVTKILSENSFTGVSVFDYKFFYPCYDGETCSRDVLRNAFTNHRWSESWVRFSFLRKILRRMGLMRLIKDIAKKS